MDEAVRGIATRSSEWATSDTCSKSATIDLEFAALVGVDRPEAREAARVGRRFFESVGAKAFVAQFDALGSIDDESPTEPPVTGSIGPNGLDKPINPRAQSRVSVGG